MFSQIDLVFFVTTMSFNFITVFTTFVELFVFMVVFALVILIVVVFCSVLLIFLLLFAVVQRPRIFLCQIFTVVAVTVLVEGLLLIPLGVGELVVLFAVRGSLENPVGLSRAFTVFLPVLCSFKHPLFVIRGRVALPM